MTKLSQDAGIRVGTFRHDTSFTGSLMEDLIGSNTASFVEPGATARSPVNFIVVLLPDGGTIQHILIRHAGRNGIFLSNTADFGKVILSSTTETTGRFPDALRISNVIRSPGWIATEHNNEFSTSNICREGVEETVP